MAKHVKKDHRKIVCDTAAAMKVSYKNLFTIALLFSEEWEEDADKEAQWLLNSFMDTNKVPDWMEGFCLKILIKKIRIVPKGKGFNLEEA